MNITPTSGILIVAKMAAPYNGTEEEHIVVYPNTTTGEFNVSFNVKESGQVKLYIVNSQGQIQHVILDKEMPKGSYTYSSNISNLVSGIYVATLREEQRLESSKIIKH